MTGYVSRTCKKENHINGISYERLEQISQSLIEWIAGVSEDEFVAEDLGCAGLEADEIEALGFARYANILRGEDYEKYE